MFFRNLTLSFFSKIVLPLLFIYSGQLRSQQSAVSVTIKDGKVEHSKPDFPINSFTNNRSAGIRRTHIINAITLDITTTGSTCGNNNGSLVAVASGGTSPYSYALSNGSGSSTFQNGNFPILSAGDYTLTVTDAAGQTATMNVTITNTFSSPILNISSHTNASGCTTQDASVTLLPTGGVPPYEYSMDGINYQASNTFSNLYSGLYPFLVRDANGCIGTTTSFYAGGLINPTCTDNGDIGFSYSTAACTNDGHIVSSPSSDVFVYSLDGVNYQPTFDFTNLTSGVHTVYFKNAAGEVLIFAIAILQSCYITINYITVDAACQQNDGILTVTATKGTAPYTYTLDGINYQTSNVFTGLSPGNYFITVNDANGFTSSLGATVYDRCPALSLTSTGEICQQSDGTITATATKGTSPYQYSLDGVNFQNNNIFTGLAAGTYTVTLRDALGFTNTATITVNGTCLTVTATTVNSTCGNNNGNITVVASDGTAPYQYSIDGVNFQANNIFTGLTAGTYSVTAKDMNGEEGAATVSVFNTAGPQINAASTSASCSNNDGVITITGVGGTLPFQFSIDGINYQANNILNSLISGSYTAWIKDANGCLASQSVLVSMDCPVVTATANDETCSNSNGRITATTINGTSPYVYSIDGINFQSNNIFSGLAAGNYTITVKDAVGITNTTTIIVSNICPTVTVSATNGLCGMANASITATGANGTSPYQYSIDGTTFQVTNSFTGLVSGTYTITIKDINGLTNTASTTVQNFPGPLIGVTNTSASCLNNDGSINIQATGGTPPFQYSIDGVSFQNNNLFNNIAGGNYNSIIKDVNGCTINQSTTVIVDSNLTLSTGNNVSICEGKEGVLPATSNGSSFSWLPVSGLNDVHLKNPLASPPVTTKYYVSATLGVCTKMDSIIVAVNPAPISYAGEDTTICYGQSVQLNGTGGIIYAWTPATYLDDPNSYNPTVMSPSTSIKYYLNATDGNGCTSLQSSSVNITVTSIARVFAGNDTSIVINQPFILSAKDINNTGFVQYTWSPLHGLNNNIIQNPETILDRNITYTVTATTESGCKGTDEINIKVYQGPEIYVPNAFTPNNDGQNDILKAIPVGIKEFRHFTIYNRWGQRIFYSSSPGTGWDGKIQNTMQQTDVFVWIAEGKDDKGNIIKRKGTVTLIR